MAVPRKKASKTKKRTRRAHDALVAPNVIYCQCGEPALSHRICPSCGSYKGRQMLRREDAEQ